MQDNESHLPFWEDLLNQIKETDALKSSEQLGKEYDWFVKMNPHLGFPYFNEPTGEYEKRTTPEERAFANEIFKRSLGLENNLD